MSSRRIYKIRKWLLESPPGEWALNQARDLLIGALRQGPIPRHVAFVMDGNRRFARNNRIETVEGHNLGFEALARILEVCYKSGVTNVTIYAFSIENFKRSKYEVDALMDMAKIKLTQLAQHGDLLERYGARIKILGQRDLLKPDVLEAMDRAVEMTADNGNTVLNVCFPYTSQDEITSAIRRTVEDYSKPIERPRAGTGRRSPFREDRIVHTIRSQYLSSPETRSGHLQPPLPSTSSSYALGQSPASSTTSLSSFANGDSSTIATYDNPSSRSSSTTTLPDPEKSDSPPSRNFTSSPPSLGNQSRSPSQLSPANTPTPTKRTYASPETITSATLTNHMFTSTDPPLDLLIRTSGVERLSDFMLWQCHQTTQIVFLSVLWPEFDLWSFLPVLWEWQWRMQKQERLLRKGRGAEGEGEDETEVEADMRISRGRTRDSIDGIAETVVIR